MMLTLAKRAVEMQSNRQGRATGVSPGQIGPSIFWQDGLIVGFGRIAPERPSAA